MNERRGFTLIEILIVVAIIAILASVVLVGLGPTQRAGRDARRLADIRSMQTALELYFNRCGFYPGAAAPAPPTPCSGAGSAPGNWGALQGVLTQSNIGVSNVPDDPNTSQHYSYGTQSPNGSGYVLGAQLEDLANSALRNSVNVTTYSVPCSQTTGLYCVQL